MFAHYMMNGLEGNCKKAEMCIEFSLVFRWAKIVNVRCFLLLSLLLENVPGHACVCNKSQMCRPYYLINIPQNKFVTRKNDSDLILFAYLIHLTFWAKTACKLTI